MPIVKLTKTKSPHKCSYCGKTIPAGRKAVTRSAHQGKLAFPVTAYYHQICWDRKNAPSGVVGEKR